MEVVSTIDFLMKTLYCDENKKATFQNGKWLS